MPAGLSGDTHQARIVVRLEGGLGNQLFQYAFARQVADRWGTDLQLDDSRFQREGPRSLDLLSFSIRADFVRPFSWNETIAARAARRFRPKRVPSRRHRLVRESFQGFDSRLCETRPSAYFVGYFLGYRYWDHIGDAISTELQLRDAAQETRLADHVALHVRRGDFLTHYAHEVLGPAYYTNAVSRLRAAVGAVRVLVFTDDVAWVAANFELPADVDWEIASTARNSTLDDFQLMRRCEHHIIANSTFSWWAAWLGQSAKSVVVAPAGWVALGRLIDDDLFPPGWLRIPRR